MTTRHAVAFFALGAVGVLVASCGSNAAAADCSVNVAMVGSTPITKALYQRSLTYTLNFYQKTNPAGKYFGEDICGRSKYKVDCQRIKQDLQTRMIDQQIVSSYAAAHGLIANSADLINALQREARIKVKLGGQAAFTAYLKKLGTDQAQFRFLESQQIETAKVIKSMGQQRFDAWLRKEDTAKSVLRCPV